MTDENITTTTEQPTIDAGPETTPKRRGNPNWVKKTESKAPVKKAAVLSEAVSLDPTWVGNKDPNMKYTWGLKNNEMEMSVFASRGYVPARGKETVMRNPFEPAQDSEGQTKERGNRILMCCPKALVDARERQRVANYVSADKAAKSDARKMGGKGFVVEGEGETTTKRESVSEEQ